MKMLVERYRRLVELCPDALFIQSDDRIVFVNTAATRLLGAATPEELLGKPVKQFVHPEDWELVQKRMAPPSPWSPSPNCSSGWKCSTCSRPGSPSLSHLGLIASSSPGGPQMNVSRRRQSGHRSSN